MMQVNLFYTELGTPEGTVEVSSVISDVFTSSHTQPNPLTACSESSTVYPEPLWLGPILSSSHSHFVPTPLMSYPC